MIEYPHPVRVRYAETDAMGMGHHANFLVWFEEARVAMLDAWGLPYRELEAEGYFMPVLEAQVRYHLPTRFDDRLIVHVGIGAVPRVRLEIEYTITRGEETVARGKTSHAFMNPEGRAIRPPETFLAVVEGELAD